MTSPSQRLQKLRTAMQAHHVDAVIIPQADPHHSEYLAQHWQMRRYFSGFTGSAGTLVVTATQAALWTDSRYFLQAAQQLEGSAIMLMKEGLPDTPDTLTWLTSTLTPGQKIAIDPTLFSYTDVERMTAEFHKASLTLVTDFWATHISTLWPDRPSLPEGPVYIHDIRFAGESATSKIERVLQGVTSRGADAVLISALGEIAWLLNLRCNSDVKYTPVLTSHLFLCKCGKRILFVNPTKITGEVSRYLTEIGVTIEPYIALEQFCRALPADVKVYLNPAQVSAAFVDALKGHTVFGPSPVEEMKGVKNEVQICGTRAAMLRDGVAMVRALHQISVMTTAGEQLTEMDVPEILVKYRSRGDNYVEESFETIAGYGPHGAIVHYAARPHTNVAIHPGNLLLIDSGANYLDGTTDITRTIAVGTPTPEQRHDFTLVMKGHIALAQAVFPEGTKGYQLDVLARMPLWQEGKMYLHGTGHGVGHFLGVHEGPHSIRLNATDAPLRCSSVTSNEPGLYLEGRYGIRCENLMLTIPAFTSEYGPFCRFETLTLCPFDRRLFDTDIMSAQEIAWVDEYHARVYAAIAPFLTDEPDTLAWLKESTAPLC